jgi:dihydrolipoamide dehydrogenase
MASMDTIKTDMAVIGSGPGGYAAAFAAADAGKRVVLVEQSKRLGGVCLNAGCIPSKALLNATHQIVAARASAKRGISFAEPVVDTAKLKEWKEGVLNKLASGIAMLAKKRNVQIVTGAASFVDDGALSVATEDGTQRIEFENAIIATGSKPALPALFDLGDPRVMTSTEALEMDGIPKTLLIIGGGYIGMELGTAYAALGTEVTVVEALDVLLAGADSDLARPVTIYAKRNFKKLHLKSKVSGLKASSAGIEVSIESATGAIVETFERVLVSVGRIPNTAGLNIEAANCELDERGFVRVDDRQRTKANNIFAIGDVVGGVMLAHKAVREARVAVGSILGSDAAKNTPHIPAVVFTDPELAWVGLTESDAKEQGVDHQIAKFSWGACGRSLTMDRIDGLTKLIVDPVSERILGVGITGPGAGELIAEATLALEMGATAKDLANTIHPHPTLSETLMEAAEVFYGHATHALPGQARN